VNRRFSFFKSVEFRKYRIPLGIHGVPPWLWRRSAQGILGARNQMLVEKRGQEASVVALLRHDTQAHHLGHSEYRLVAAVG